jgi:hypothetical protein
VVVPRLFSLGDAREDVVPAHDHRLTGTAVVENSVTWGKDAGATIFVPSEWMASASSAPKE